VVREHPSPDGDLAGETTGELDVTRTELLERRGPFGMRADDIVRLLPLGLGGRGELESDQLRARVVATLRELCELEAKVRVARVREDLREQRFF
jgi:hypothetical protein